MKIKNFTIHYPDGSRKNVSHARKEQMLLAGELRKRDERNYVFVGSVLTFRTFSGLAALLPRMNSGPLVRFYPGMFVWLLSDIRRRELLESPEAMTLRLRNPRGKHCVFTIRPRKEAIA